MKIKRLGKGPRVHAEVLAHRPDGNVLVRATWRYRGKDMVNNTVLTPGYFLRRYGMTPAEAAA